MLDELLDQLKKKRKLCVVIITHDKFLKDNTKKGVRNLSKIKELTRLFPERFSVVLSPDVWLLGLNTAKKSTNHTKATVIDYGAAYILGGSGIKDNFVLAGVDNPLAIIDDPNGVMSSFQQRCAQRKRAWKDVRETTQQFLLHNSQLADHARQIKDMVKKSPKYSTRAFKEVFELLDQIVSKLSEANQLITEDNTAYFATQIPHLVTWCKANAKYVQLKIDLNSNNNCDEGFLAKIIPGNFRDGDFVCLDPNDRFSAGIPSAGTQLFVEILRLAFRWEQLQVARGKAPYNHYSPDEAANFAIFKTGKLNYPNEIAKNDSVTQRIMKNPIPPRSELKTSYEFENFDGKKGDIRMIYQGPEQPSGSTALASTLLYYTRRAQRKIVIDHLYFAPTDEILDALIAAVNRGVAVEIITAGVTKNCPNGQKFFGPYNEYRCSNFIESVDPEYRDNIHVFLYQQRKKGLHRKVIVFDGRFVVAGSSNFAYKSLYAASDHEVNFIADSRELARDTLKVCEEDKRFSVEVGTKKFSPREMLQIGLYSATRPLFN